MKNKHKYTIPFTGLSYGQHEFKFTIDKAFFELFEESELHNGLIEIHIDLYKTSEILNLDIDLEGTVNIECDRCLDTFSQPIEFQAKLNIEFGDESSDISDADENIILSRKETDLDLSQHFYDYINLALPIRRIHPKDKNGKSICNKEMIKKLKELTNEEKETETDPRWDTLKNLLN